MLTKSELLDAYAAKDYATVLSECIKYGNQSVGLDWQFEIKSGPNKGKTMRRQLIQHHELNWHFEFLDGKIVSVKVG
jgi:hypothetical protein